MLLISSPRFDEHVTPPGHPERPERAHVLDVVASAYRERGGRVVEPEAATREELAELEECLHAREIERQRIPTAREGRERCPSR